MADAARNGYKHYVDTSFVVGDSPVTEDILTNLGRKGQDGYIANDGSGDFTVAISEDGSAFGDEITVKNGESFGLNGLNVSKIRITHVADSSYRIFVK